LDTGAADSRVLELELEGQVGAYEDDGGRNAQHHHYHEVNHKSFLGALLGREVTVLPDDVGWLGGLLGFN